MNDLAKEIYLELSCSKGYENQTPEYKCAKGKDLIWFIIPVIGVLFFINSIENRYNNLTAD